MVRMGVGVPQAARERSGGLSGMMARRMRKLKLKVALPAGRCLCLCLVLAGLLSSCSVVPTPHGYAGFLGGRGEFQTSADGGVSFVYNQEKSFRDGMVAAAALSASYYGAVASKAVEATKQQAAGHAAKTQQTQIATDGVVRQAEIAAGAVVQ